MSNTVQHLREAQNHALYCIEKFLETDNARAIAQTVLRPIQAHLGEGATHLFATTEADIDLASTLLGPAGSPEQEGPPGPQLTLPTLASIFLAVATEPRPQHRSRLRQFLRRFEVTGKLYASYDDQGRRACTSFDNILSYSVLCACLLDSDPHAEEPEFLNCALKLADLLAQLVSHIDDCTAACLTLYALARTEIVLKDFYHRRKFSLPAT